MASFAPPVRRGDFFYSSVLYADAGNGNHHPRASVAELAALLRLEAVHLYTKSKKPPSTSPAKDPVGHWYSAQLIHYGLPVTKDKNAAKVRLLNALNQFKLEVPRWILDLEGDLKKEWESENRKLKRSSNGTKTPNRKGVGNSGVSSSQGINVNVNVSLSQGLSMIEQLGVAPVSNTAFGQQTPTKRKRDNDKPSQAKARSKTTTSSQRTLPSYDSSPTLASYSPAKKPRLKKERESKTLSPSRPRIKSESSSYRLSSSYIKQEHASPRSSSGYIKQESAPLLLSGSYTLTCIHTGSPAEMNLYLDENCDIWWATLYYDQFEFLIRMAPGPSVTPLGEACNFGWRMRDIDSGELMFERSCQGAMRFYDDQSVSDWLEGPRLDTVVFEGDRNAGPREVGDFQAMRDEFVNEAYGR